MVFINIFTFVYCLYSGRLVQSEKDTRREETEVGRQHQQLRPGGAASLLLQS